MIYQYLANCLKAGKFYNSWLIKSAKPQEALQNVQKFVEDKLLITETNLANNPDFMLVKREQGNITAKNISVAQIRLLQNFLYKTTSLSDNKVAIIFEAEWLNHNSANCLLKVLEDTPKNSYIFLITHNTSNILLTIQSRCAKLFDVKYSQAIINSAYEQYLTVLDNQVSFTVKLPIIKENIEKDRDNWLSFADSILLFINRAAKKAMNINITLQPLEKKIISQFAEFNIVDLLEKYSKAKQLIEDTISLDLELKASTILLIELFKPK